jgi:hypothetical protein
MTTISFARHQFSPAIIRHAVWLYVRFTLCFRDVEDLLAERGLDVSYETVRRWVLKFGPLSGRPMLEGSVAREGLVLSCGRILAAAPVTMRRRPFGLGVRRPSSESSPFPPP